MPVQVVTHSYKQELLSTYMTFSYTQFNYFIVDNQQSIVPTIYCWNHNFDYFNLTTVGFKTVLGLQIDVSIFKGENNVCVPFKY